MPMHYNPLAWKLALGLVLIGWTFLCAARRLRRAFVPNRMLQPPVA